MLINQVTDNLKPGEKLSNEANHLFVFLEIFALEGGIQSYIKDIFRGYLGLEQTCRAEVFLLRDSDDCVNPFASENLKFHYFKSELPQIGRVKFTLALLRYLLQKRPQHVFCGHIKLAVLIKTLCKPLGIPYTVLTYGKEVWEPLKNQERRALTSASSIWTISRYSRDCACAANDINPDQVKMLPCAIDGDKFTPGIKAPELVEKYGLNNAKVLMTVARLWSGDIYKGVDVTIRALPQIMQVFPEVKYLVIGRGDDQPRLAELAKDLGVSDRVIFAGFIATEALMLHYRLADAYVMPSQEGFGIVYLEAMACGIPVLSGDNDGSADPLQDGKLGWRVPHRNPDAVAAACIEILQGQDQRCDGEWLREQAIAIFGIEAFQKRLQQMLLSSSQLNS
ncbi:glycosyltransferase [Anabaena cylindrica FACHB-243]|uniref:Glycosyl transferase group 1 n=1 Tax=Anabaena cylindrica (strain ATCC 27899 / PCC 7122) TaxID=272123 RepID=K9ZNI0_ANACC|nr:MULTISPECIES: glycosyltransferase [Anabaena]AFZ60107.1 glycosyl transferase group 1 [Anabaena cylindrica PCC 7122]MBD2417837.1 glycosyltransferase [Anabaena cylindrica FACHB-243]MBY5283742.1 glycosyltransferase family 4 protein [Anabaena sp. CCAP 1446/1C]MBY5307970.1 glycosyltransferase family 4 protein [Anabaena sp. CCAP 1446/1C]MCM2404752.1 glycosyltransferase [Anabaena sp. CCAP 1446/1C]